ncbi:MAG TPA: hypothetical protein VFZ11_11555 [Gemmatimonadaceae bacterium]
MLHLPAERLAALADDEPTTVEADHLAACAACAREWRAYRTLGNLAAGARGAAEAPLLSWDALSERLRAEGLQSPAPADISSAHPLHAIGPAAARAVAARRWMMRAAAAVVLFAAGAVAGRVSHSVTAADATADPLADVAGEASLEDATFASEEAALAVMLDAERRYQLAATYLVANDSATQLDDADGYRTRLAALDEVAAATRRALYQAPDDPVINRYYLTTLGAREATLRQLGATLEPSGMQVGRF